ncbi:MAG: hypothetical protein WCE21_05160 [Candidatus Babeliales bacterium]
MHRRLQKHERVLVMEESSPIKKLMELVSFDQQTVTLSRDVAHQQKQVTEYTQEKQRLTDAVDRTHESLKQARRMVDDKELEMASLDTQLKEIKRKTEALKHARDYEPLAKEGERIKEKQTRIEEELIEAWKTLEHLDTQYKNIKKDTTLKCDQLEVTIADTIKKITQMQQEHAHRLTQRNGLMTGIDPELLKKYDMLYQQVSNPVVPVANGSCSACFYAMTNQDITNLRKRRLLQCKECFRLLYLPE